MQSIIYLQKNYLELVETESFPSTVYAVNAFLEHKFETLLGLPKYTKALSR